MTVNPAAATRPPTWRVRWQPPISRLVQRLERRCSRRTPVGRESVLDEVQRAARLEHPAELGQRGVEFGIVHIVHVDSAASKLSSANGNCWPSRPARSIGTVAVGEPLLGELPADSAGSTRRDFVTVDRVVRDVQPRPEPDLDDLSGQPVTHPLPVRRERPDPAALDDAWKDPLGVQTHRLLLASMAPPVHLGAGRRCVMRRSSHPGPLHLPVRRTSAARCRPLPPAARPRGPGNLRRFQACGLFK